MKLILLGTGGYHPTSERHTACLVMPEVGLVLDAGTSIFRLPGHLVTKELDIFLTHAHLDHVVGLTYLLGLLWERPVSRLTVHGEPAKLAAIREHLFAEALFPVPPRFEMRPLAPEVSLTGGAASTGSLSLIPAAALGTDCIGPAAAWPT